MRIWAILEWVSTILLIGVIGAMLLAPLSFLARYGFFLLFTTIALIFITFLRSFLGFIKDIPQRKWSAPKIEPTPRIIAGLSTKTWKRIVEWGGLAIVLIVLLLFQRGIVGTKDCPDVVRGNAEGNVTLQFFYSPFCPACWKGESIVQNLIAKYPDVRFENFDKRYCKNAASTASVTGSPAYVITGGNTSKLVYGVNEQDAQSALCEVRGC